MTQTAVRKLSADRPAGPAAGGERDAALDYLRSFVIVLVVLLHAALAYANFSVFNYARYVESTAPVVDSVRWPVLDLLILTIDTFAMPLLFLVSGIFAVDSLRRRGSRGFFSARLRRLGIPFVIAALILSPLSFWPSYLQAGIGPAPDFWKRCYTVDGWQTGPIWFLWLLLAFDGVAALVFRIAPRTFDALRRRPSLPAVFLVAIAVFAPVYVFASPYEWTSILGLIDVQPARIPLYFAFFLMGMAFAAHGERRSAGPERWGICLAVGISSLVPFFSVGPEAADPFSRLIAGTAFATCCTGVSLGLLGAFRRFARTHRPAQDSLSKNSFGIYLLHYGIIVWIQFTLLPVSAPAWAKFVFALGAGLAFSWGLAAWLRRIPAVQRWKIL
jgi:glucan biosynthesis protein C